MFVTATAFFFMIMMVMAAPTAAAPLINSKLHLNKHV